MSRIAATVKRGLVRYVELMAYADPSGMIFVPCEEAVPTPDRTPARRADLALAH